MMEHVEHFEKRFKNNQPAVIAVFKDHSVLEKTLDDLKGKKFNNDDISIVMAQSGDTKEFTDNLHLKGSAVTGLLAGMVAGALMGRFSGTKKGQSPLKVALQWSLYGGAIGSVSGTLIKYGISKRESRKLESYVKDKGIIVSVHVDNPKELLTAKNILVANGAVKIFNPYEEEFSQVLN